MKRLICRLRGHRWVPRGPYIADPDGGVPIIYWACVRCGTNIGPIRQGREAVTLNRPVSEPTAGDKRRAARDLAIFATRLNRVLRGAGWPECPYVGQSPAAREALERGAHTTATISVSTRHLFDDVRWVLELSRNDRPERIAVEAAVTFHRGVASRLPPHRVGTNELVRAVRRALA